VPTDDGDEEENGKADDDRMETTNPVTTTRLQLIDASEPGASSSNTGDSGEQADGFFPR